MDGRKVARQVRLQYWSGVIQARQQSGQTIREYCGENDVNEKSYYYWQNRLREAACEALAVRQENGAAPTFSEIPLPLSRSNQHAAITIRTGDSVVEIGSDATPALVEQVLRALRFSCYGTFPAQSESASPAGTRI